MPLQIGACSPRIGPLGQAVAFFVILGVASLRAHRLSLTAAAAGAGLVMAPSVAYCWCAVCVCGVRGVDIVCVWRGGVRDGGLPQGGGVVVLGVVGGEVCVAVVVGCWVGGGGEGPRVDMYRAVRWRDYDAHLLTAVGFEPTPFRTGTWSQRLGPLGQTVLVSLVWVLMLMASMLSLVAAAAGAGVATAAADVSMCCAACAWMGWGRESARA